MDKTVVIGLGGFGTRVAADIARHYKKKHSAMEDMPVSCCAIDCDQSDMMHFCIRENLLPAFPICTEHMARDLVDMYDGLGVKEWFPLEKTSLFSSLGGYTCHSRAAARLMFLDYCERGGIRELERWILVSLPQNLPDSKVRIVIVSSLCGNLGSGILSQVALHLREMISDYKLKAIIYAALALPGVYESFDVDPRRKAEMECQAAASIKEIGAISDTLMGRAKTKEPIKLYPYLKGDESDRRGYPLFDGAFLFDADKDEHEARSVDSYVSDVSRFIGARFISGSSKYLNSTEHMDLSTLGKMGKFASGAVTKLTYPREDVVNYCALRTAAERVAPYWRAIDRELSGRDLSFTSYGAAYLKAFERKAEEDADFGRLLSDTKVGDKDRADALMESIDGIIGDILSKKAADEVERRVPMPDIQDIDDLERLRGEIESARGAHSSVIEISEGLCNDIASEALYLLSPDDVSDVDFLNARSLPAVFCKTDEDGRIRFVNPGAAKYVLYKFCERAREELSVKCSEAREAHLLSTLRHGDSQIWETADFVSNSKAPSGDYAPISAIERKKMLMSTSAFIHKYLMSYEEYRKEVVQTLIEYLRLVVKKDILSALLSKIKILISNIDEPSERASDIIKESLFAAAEKSTHSPSPSLRYVYSSVDAKARLYDAMGADGMLDIVSVNEKILKNAYALACKDVLPCCEANLKYLEGEDATLSVVKALVKAVKRCTEECFAHILDLDIIGALCRESDLYSGPVAGESDAERADRYGARIDASLREMGHLCDTRVAYDENMSLEYRQLSRGVLCVNESVLDIVSRYSDGALPRAVVCADAELRADQMVYTRIVCGTDISSFAGFGGEDRRYIEAYERAVSAIENGDVQLLDCHPHIDKTWHTIL